MLISLVFTKYYFLLTNEYYPPAYAYKIANFEAEKVFQKRFLIPVIADLLSQNTPFTFDQSLKFINVFFTYGILYYFKRLLDIFSDGNAKQYWSTLILIPISWNYMFINSIYHAYDIPTLLFYCSCMCFFLNKRYTLFYIFFIIATLNRESTCFITISILILQYNFNNFLNIKENIKQNLSLTKHLFTQTIAWILLITLIRCLIADSPGTLYETTYSMKVFVSNMWNGSTSWPFLNTENFFENPRSFLTLFGFSWVIIRFLWKYIPQDCKRLLFLIPIFMIPALIYANLMEARVYHELNVVIALAVTTGFIEANYCKRNHNLKTRNA